jgi:hypothetical protein
MYITEKEFSVNRKRKSDENEHAHQISSNKKYRYSGDMDGFFFW